MLGAGGYEAASGNGPPAPRAPSGAPPTREQNEISCRRPAVGVGDCAPVSVQRSGGRGNYAGVGLEGFAQSARQAARWRRGCGDRAGWWRQYSRNASGLRAGPPGPRAAFRYPQPHAKGTVYPCRSPLTVVCGGR
jgi:hypothetical protein